MQNLGQAILIMSLGMGGVFAFLTVQAFITVLLERLAPADEIATTAGSRSVPSAVTPSTGDGSHVAVIQAAVTAYESDKGVRKS